MVSNPIFKNNPSLFLCMTRTTMFEDHFFEWMNWSSIPRTSHFIKLVPKQILLGVGSKSTPLSISIPEAPYMVGLNKNNEKGCWIMKFLYFILLLFYVFLHEFQNSLLWCAFCCHIGNFMEYGTTIMLPHNDIISTMGSY